MNGESVALTWHRGLPATRTGRPFGQSNEAKASMEIQPLSLRFYMLQAAVKVGDLVDRSPVYDHLPRVRVRYSGRASKVA